MCLSAKETGREREVSLRPEELRKEADGQAIEGHPWHVLQFSDVLDLEFARALSEGGPVILWEPRRRLLPLGLRPEVARRAVPAAALQVQSFPVMRGFARLPLGLLARAGGAVRAQLLGGSEAPEDAVLLCTTPHFAPVAEGWPGPAVYWLTDMIAEYEGANRARIRELDRRMCSAARLVCPNSERLAGYLQEEAGCEPGKICVLPNATRACNILPAPLAMPTDLPVEVTCRRRPVAGVIGALGGNMDWIFLQKLLALTPWMSWVFVGPTDLHIGDRRQGRARAAVMREERACFTGPCRYGRLFTYARALSVAILPYCHREPTYSGSSTRFYEHLAAGRPMLATPGVAELLDKEPLLKLVETAEDAACVLERLRACGFDDGLQRARWEASKTNTWSRRAATMRAALTARS